jgi:hypothetical protein
VSFKTLAPLRYPLGKDYKARLKLPDKSKFEISIPLHLRLMKKALDLFGSYDV